jgi:8-oxo-dGTP pyrophosphatase MutT (NUDIX family)
MAMSATSHSPRNQGGGRGNFDPAQMRERMMNRIKEQLGATDDEWKAIQPKVDKVMTAQRESRGRRRLWRIRRRGGGGGGGGAGGGGGGGGGADQQPTTAVGKASQDLRTTLDNKDAAPETIAKKLAALREAREKARKDVADAQKELKEILTQRQEAVLVINGMLE